MNIPADVEVKFEFNNQRRYPVASGFYRPHHLVKDDYMTTGLHHYYDVVEVASGGSAYGTITFLSPEYYPHSLYIVTARIGKIRYNVLNEEISKLFIYGVKK